MYYKDCLFGHKFEGQLKIAGIFRLMNWEDPANEVHKIRLGGKILTYDGEYTNYRKLGCAVKITSLPDPAAIRYLFEIMKQAIAKIVWNTYGQPTIVGWYLPLPEEIRSGQRPAYELDMGLVTKEYVERTIPKPAGLDLGFDPSELVGGVVQ